MGGYDPTTTTGNIANVTYEEINHRKVPARRFSFDDSTDVEDSFDCTDGSDNCESSVCVVPTGAGVGEEMYVNVGPFRTYSNGSQYITLANGETVDIAEPLYQRISFEEYAI